MKLLIDRYHGVAYIIDEVNTTLEELVDDGDITILDISGCSEPKILIDGKFELIELHQKYSNEVA